MIELARRAVCGYPSRMDRQVLAASFALGIRADAIAQASTCASLDARARLVATMRGEPLAAVSRRASEYTGAGVAPHVALDWLVLAGE